MLRKRQFLNDKMLGGRIQRFQTRNINTEERKRK